MDYISASWDGQGRLKAVATPVAWLRAYNFSAKPTDWFHDEHFLVAYTTTVRAEAQLPSDAMCVRLFLAEFQFCLVSWWVHPSFPVLPVFKQIMPIVLDPPEAPVAQR